MNRTAERNAATQLAKRIEVRLVDPSKIDEAKRPPEDQPPGFVDTIFSQETNSVEQSADLSHEDWDLISRALEHYAGCQSG